MSQFVGYLLKETTFGDDGVAVAAADDYDTAFTMTFQRWVEFWCGHKVNLSYAPSFAVQQKEITPEEGESLNQIVDSKFREWRKPAAPAQE